MTLYEGLSKRATEILHLLADGMSDREIAERLMMTINTVKWYNRQIYSVLNVGSRTQAIARAYELQILDKANEASQIISSASKHNLPVETTRFVGRTREKETIKHLLETAHLLTLVGPPGTGKTRLALQTAWELLETFRDGVYFVSLAPVSDPSMVLSAIATAIEVNETHGQPLIETLKRILHESQMLLILDNFEHLLLAATQISELLTAAPHLKVLATSREPLHLYREQEYAVPPLELPDIAQLEPQQLVECESIALFLQKARAVRTDFELTPENAMDIAQICIQLEGLPLAIELAASRIKLLTPQALLNRLNNRLATLVGGAHDLPTRQQTLYNTIEWSYNLLTEEEKILFARVAVFRGGYSLEAIESVCSPNLPIEVFDGLESLVNKSLIQQKESPSGEPRFIMLETLHEYAKKLLGESGEAETIYRRHARYFAELAQCAKPELRRSGFSYWMERLETEENNLRVALEWSLGGGDTELGVQLVVSLRDFWVFSSHFVQADYWTHRALSKADSLPINLRIELLTSVGRIFYYLSQPELQKQLLEEAIYLARQIDDKSNLAWALTFLAIAEVGQASEYKQALALTKEGLSLFRALGDKPGMAQALNIIGELARTNGDDARAKVAYEECLLVVHETGEVRREAMMLNNLGCIAMHQADVEGAERLFKQALVKRLEVGHDKHGVITNLIFLAGALGAKGDLARSARLFGAADALLEPMGVGLEPGDQPEYERNLAFVRSQLDDEKFQNYWNEGREFSFDHTVSYALEHNDAEK